MMDQDPQLKRNGPAQRHELDAKKTLFRSVSIHKSPPHPLNSILMFFLFFLDLLFIRNPMTNIYILP